jgi:hypothetical protein
MTHDVHNHQHRLFAGAVASVRLAQTQSPVEQQIKLLLVHIDIGSAIVAAL